MGTENDAGDYYDRKAEERRQAAKKFDAARCSLCFGLGFAGSSVHGVPCAQCKGSKCAPGVTPDELRRLREEYERACYVGD